MQSSVSKQAMDQFFAAIRAGDAHLQMRIINENLARATGPERADWLRRRVDLSMTITESKVVTEQLQADLDEANRLSADAGTLLGPFLQRVYALQQLEPLREVPDWIWSVVRREEMRTEWLWMAIGDLHYLRRRWYQWYRALGKAISKLEEREPSFLQYYEGYLSVLHANRARAGLRCKRLTLVESDLARAEAIAKARPTVYPGTLTLARGEWYLHRGETQAALSEIHHCLARVAAESLKWHETERVDIDLLAARIARAEGNQAGFEHFCQKALTYCLERQRPMQAAHVRAIMAGEPF